MYNEPHVTSTKVEVLCVCQLDADAAAARDEKEGGGAHCNHVIVYSFVSNAHLYVASRRALLLAGRHLPEGRSEEAGGLERWSGLERQRRWCREHRTTICIRDH